MRPNLLCAEPSILTNREEPATWLSALRRQPRLSALTPVLTLVPTGETGTYPDSVVMSSMTIPGGPPRPAPRPGGERAGPVQKRPTSLNHKKIRPGSCRRVDAGGRERSSGPSSLSIYNSRISRT
jgi:hypothetical protein